MEGGAIALQVIDSGHGSGPGDNRGNNGIVPVGGRDGADRAEGPTASEGSDFVPVEYSGRHRGSDRYRQLTRTGGILGVIAVLLAAGGLGFYWATKDEVTTPLVDATGVGELCPLAVAVTQYEAWVDVAEPTLESSQFTKDDVKTFECIFSAETAGDQTRAATSLTTLQVFPTESDAREAMKSFLDLEATEGREAEAVNGVGDQAAVVIFAEGGDQRWRFFSQSGNALVSAYLYISGAPVEDAAGSELLQQSVNNIMDQLPRIEE